MYCSIRHDFSIFARLIDRNWFEQLWKMIRFSDLENEVQVDKFRFIIEHLSNVYANNYAPEQNLALYKYLSLWKPRRT